jgi:tetratricopeptide (TPR) repeat protein
MLRFWVRSLVCFLSVASCLGQAKPSPNSSYTRGVREYQTGQFALAERDFRDATNADPSDIYAEFYLGQSLFKQQKFPDAVGPFEKARQLEGGGKKLTSDQHRILVDQLVIAYGISGDLKKVHTLLDDAIRQDPDYPLNYYNLACAFAEEGDKAKMLASLSTAFQHKDHVIKGEHMPDPRTDDSFQKYVHDDDFVKLMKELGYN